MKSSETDDFSLLGATVSPGFEFEDFELGEVQALLSSIQGSDLESQKLFRKFFGI